MAVILTTTDNPYDPFTKYDEWYQFDEMSGYHTCSYLARIVKSSEALSSLEEAEAVERAIDEILFFNITGNYIKVSNESENQEE